VQLLEGVSLSSSDQCCAERLARFFPDATSVRIPIQVSACQPGAARLREATTIEFGCPEHAIFLSTLPLEFNDRVRLEHSDKPGVVDAFVIAVQYHLGSKAVAVRFLHGPCEWVTNP
jgi:hypothetical protein